MAAGDVHRGVAIHLACTGREVLLAELVGIGVDATTAAIHVADVDVVLAGGVGGIAHGASRDAHGGVFKHVAVFAAAEHRAVDVGPVADVDVGVAYVGQVSVGRACQTLGGSEHIAVLVAGGADLSAADVDRGLAEIGGFGVVAHRGHGAAAIHAAVNQTVGDVHLGLFIHTARRGADGAAFAVHAASAAEHVALEPVLVIVATDDATADVDDGLVLHMGVLAAAEHRAGDACRTAHADDGVVHK